jgi:hypothetical protein
VWTAWWQEHQDEVEDGFLVELQNQGRVVIGGGHIKFEGFAVVHQKITKLLS